MSDNEIMTASLSAHRYGMVVNATEGDALTSLNWRAILQKPIDTMLDDEAAMALSLTDLVGKALGDRAKALKKRVQKLITDHGEQHTEATKKMSFGPSGVEVHVTQKADKVTINETALMAVLAEKGMDRGVVFDMVPQLNAARLEQLIASGELTDEEITRFTDSSPGSVSVSVKSHVAGLKKADLLEG